MFFSSVLKAILRRIYGEPPAPPVGDKVRGLVLVADGVGGLNLLATSLQYAAPGAGLQHEVRLVDWGHGFGRWHSDLTNVGNHGTKSEALAAEVEQFRKVHPDRPVYLIGKSGGSGVAVRALELLPEGSVESAVLLAPALSPVYNLARALRALRNQLVVFWSPLDVFVLGLGTRIFGTIDRVHSVSAGLVGFRPPEDLGQADAAAYDKLCQVRWRFEMARTGYMGGHVGPDMPSFLRKYVVPLLLESQVSGEPAPADNGPVGSSAVWHGA